MTIADWILGPQLIGAIIMMAGIIMVKYPPKKINNWYGYRTDSSKVNQQTWDEANRFSARYMVRVGAIFVVLGLLLAAILGRVEIRGDLKHNIMPILMILMGSLPAILIIVTTENHLSKTFDKKTK